MLRKLFIALAAASCIAVQASESQNTEANKTATAIFAGGCFWCMEGPYDKLDGVLETTSGYTGGHLENPTYEQVTMGNTGHYEAVAITYDPDKVSYEKLLDVFWQNIDPFDKWGQFCDKGSSYLSAIFFQNDAEKKLAEATKQAIAERFDKTVHTAVLPASTFYPAEDYHQDYYKKNPMRYTYYRFACGRDGRLEKIWGKS